MAEKKSTRGRKAKDHTVDQVGPDLSTRATDESIAQQAGDLQLLSAHDQHLATIDASYGYNLPYDRGRIENECRFYMQESATAMLEAGKRLILIKEHEKHGEFVNSLERIGVDPRIARRMMQASVKFSDPKRTALSVLGKTKLLELMLEDDDDLDALAEGGTIAGLELDKIEKMTTRELKAALRKEREKHQRETEANEKLIAKKDSKINEFERRSRLAPTLESYTFELTVQAGAAAKKASVEMEALRTMLAGVGDMQAEHNAPDDQMQAIAVEALALITDLRERFQELDTDFHASLAGYLPADDASDN